MPKALVKVAFPLKSLLNNNLINLEWLSRSDNIKHSREILGLIPIPYSKTIKKHLLKGKTGTNSNKGIK